MEKIRVSKNKDIGAYLTAVMCSVEDGNRKVVIAGLGQASDKCFDIAQRATELLDVEVNGSELFSKDGRRGVEITLKVIKDG